MTTPTAPTSRRAMLTAALGAAAAAVATSLGRPRAARAADTGNMIIGADNHGNTPTTIANDDTNENAFTAYSTGTAAAILGQSTGGSVTSYGVRGNDATGTGVRGDSTSGSGVAGDSTTGVGVYGVSTDAEGVWGDSTNGHGVRGATTNGQFAGVYGTGPFRGVVGVTSGAGTVGMYGESTGSGPTYGVMGNVGSPGGFGVAGTANSSGTGLVGYITGGPTPAGLPGVGVYGASGYGRGVVGSSNDFDGVYGETGAASAAGVRGHSLDGSGVVGTTEGQQAYGVSGTAPYVGVLGQAMLEGGYGVGGTAMSGPSGAGTGVFGVVNATGTGVRGFAGEQAFDSLVNVGVHGESESGRGVVGTSQEVDGVYGETGAATAAGVRGFSASGYGVWGSSTAGIGVGANSSDVSAISGRSQSGTKAAILGHSAGPGAGSERTGVMGFSGQTAPAGAPAKTGVYGYSAVDANARGVHGNTTSGRGVYGQATSGAGVYGLATTGYALRTSGRVKLEKTSGSVVITNPATVSGPITPGVALTSSSLVIATVQTNGGANVAVKRVTITTGATGSFTITLTAAPTTNVKVAWLLLN